MSIHKHHNEWLQLVESSGPFLSLPVLVRAFPQGLFKHDPDVASRLRLGLAEWSESSKDPAVHGAWIRFVLRDTLGLTDEVLREGQALPPGLSARVAEERVELRPDLAVVNHDEHAEPGKARLLVAVYPVTQDLESSVRGERWIASPATRMMELLHATNVPLGLVTNGDRWLLVYARPGESTGFASFYTSLFVEEPLTLRAFRTLLGAERFFAASTETLEALLLESATDQHEVTDQLGRQVLRAVEILVQEVDRNNRDRKGALLSGFDERELYEAAVTVMMRLVFLFAAEERDLLLLGDALYDENYAVSTLREQLRQVADRHGEEVLERRHDAWSRLLATFRAVYGGVEHGRMRLRAYGGSLFDPDRFPFLEGRAKGTSWRDADALPLPISNRTVLHLLEALQILEVRVGRGIEIAARRLSFRGLDIEQIGHVYEGLLDHTAKRATELVLGLQGAKGSEPEVGISALEAALANGRDVFGQELEEETGRKASAVLKALDAELDDEDRLRIACGHDEALFARVRPFAGLLRVDSRGFPVVYPKGSVYVTVGDDRRSTGTHYTPRSLTEPLVKHALDPLVYRGPADGKPESEWVLKTPKELLALRVCDLAMGSGAFLVQACRYLAEKLVEAWATAERAADGLLLLTPSGELSTGSPTDRVIPTDPNERLVIAKRAVASRCLYGVDKNPMATEMAKLSLWLVTLEKDKPFTFVDHALRTGDSLVGITDPDQVRHFHVVPSRGKELHHDLPLFDDTKHLEPLLRRAVAKRRALESFVVDDVRDTEKKEQLLREAEAAIAEVRIVCDLIVAGIRVSAGRIDKKLDEWLEKLAPDVDRALKPGVAEAERAERFAKLAARARSGLGASAAGGMKGTGAGRGSGDSAGSDGLGRRGAPRAWAPFHWLVEFPEVFLEEEGRGFDAFVGNPPFQGGQKITGALGDDYREWLVHGLADGARGSADLCAYFFLRAYGLLKEGGGFGLIATNTIAQGDTREVGLDQLTARGGQLVRAIPSMKWPGGANLEIACVWMRRGAWSGGHVLAGAVVRGITPYLVVPGKATGKPYRLKANEGKSFQGSNVVSLGFMMSEEEARALIAADPRNGDVLYPYITGKDVNSSPTQAPGRWIINFFDWPLSKADGYPDCMRIVREKVKPERDANNRKVYRDYWWHYAEKRPALYARIRELGCTEVIAVSLVNNHLPFALLPAGWVYSHKLAIFPVASTHLALLQSSLHYTWAWSTCSTMRVDINYSPTDAFATFPTPSSIGELEPVLERYLTSRRAALLTQYTGGLTALYNRFHARKEDGGDVITLRLAHRELDQAVAAAYGWTDLDLGHDFHETKQGVRFTISEAARREVLDRLLELNHARYAEEVKQGLHPDAAPKKPNAKSTKTPASKRPARAEAPATPPAAPTPSRSEAPATPAKKRTTAPKTPTKPPKRPKGTDQSGFGF